MEYRRPVVMDNEQNKLESGEGESQVFFFYPRDRRKERGSTMALLSREKNGGRIFPRSLFLFVPSRSSFNRSLSLGSLPSVGRVSPAFFCPSRCSRKGGKGQ